MKSRIIKVIAIRLITIFLAGVVAIYLSVISLDNSYENYIFNQTTKKLNIGYLNYPDNYSLLCLITGCSNMVKKNPVTGLYKLYDATPNYNILGRDPSENIKVPEYKTFPILNNNYDLFLLNQNSLGFYKEKDYPFTYTKDNLFTIAISLLILSLLLSLILSWIDYWIKRFQFKQNLLELNNELRGEITESLHHELGGPISVIETNTEYLLRHMKEYLVEHKNHGALRDRITTTHTALKSIRSILEIVSDLKQLKYTSDPIEISVILDNIKALNRLKTYDVSKVKINNRDVLKGLCLGNELSEGHVFNSILTLINNSNEAGATKINITPEFITNNKICIYVADNGRGILDSKGQIEKNLNKVFYYGYSTKEPKIVKKINMIKQFFLVLFGDSNAIITSRGAGLAIARKILQKHGGNLEVDRTSPQGTIFKITLPVTKETEGGLPWQSQNHG